MRAKAPPPVPPRSPPPIPPRNGVMPEITSGSILSIIPISVGHPVFQLVFRNGPTLVIKVEEHQGTGVYEFKDGMNNISQDVTSFASHNVSQISGVMGIVSTRVQNTALSLNEMSALNSFSSKPAELIEALKRVNSKIGFFVKMPYTTGIKTMGASMKRQITLNDTQELAQLAGDLKGNRAAWESLGSIFAADMFVGNGDRVMWEEGKVTNPGNLIFQRDASGKITRAVGLDAYDPNAGFESFMYGTNIEAWKASFGHSLKDMKGYRRLAAQVMDSINDTWLKIGGVAERFGPMEITALAVGMEKGQAALKARIGGDIKAGKKTASGIVARAAFLGWA